MSLLLHFTDLNSANCDECAHDVDEVSIVFLIKYFKKFERLIIFFFTLGTVYIFLFLRFSFFGTFSSWSGQAPSLSNHISLCCRIYLVLLSKIVLEHGVITH